MSEVIAIEKTRVRGLYEWLIHPPIAGSAATLLLRLMAGGVFLSEGILKNSSTPIKASKPISQKLGLPTWPHFTATFVGGLEIVGGLLLIAGLLTRLTAIPFIVEMVVAILATKISLYLGTSPLPLPPAPPTVGFWAVVLCIETCSLRLRAAAHRRVLGVGRSG